MNQDSNDKDQLDDSEKDIRKFTLSLVFIIIGGTSAIFFMLQYRSAKRAVAEIQRESVSDKADLAPKSSPRSLISKRPDSRIPSAGEPQFKKLKPTPIDSNKFPQTGGFKFYPRDGFELSQKSFRLGKAREYEAVLDYVAVDEEFKERFDSNDIIGEKLGRILVKEEEAKGIKSEQIVRNARTGQLGIVTGVIVVTFKTSSYFQQRNSLIPESFKEVRDFAGINAAIWSGDEVTGIEELSALQVALLKNEKFKKVTIEILEQGRVSK